MPRFLVTAKVTNDCALYIEAASQREAKERAEKLEYRDFELDPDAWSVEIGFVEEV